MLKTTKFLQKNTELTDETKKVMEHHSQMIINLISDGSESDSVEGELDDSHT